MRASFCLLFLSFALLTACEASHAPGDTGSDAGPDTRTDAAADTRADAAADTRTDAAVEADAEIPITRCPLPVDAGQAADGPGCALENEPCTVTEDCCNRRHTCFPEGCHY